MAKHNMHTTSTYTIWRGIKKRCNLPSHPSYRWYGGQGISYDPKWETFLGFLEDMGERPGEMTIDRINPALNYTKENCRWVTIQENLKNRRAMKQRANKRSTCACGVKIARYYAKQCWNCYSKTRLLEHKKDAKTGRFVT